MKKEAVDAPENYSLINPLAQVGGTLLLTLPVLISFDPVTPLLTVALSVPFLIIFLRPRLKFLLRFLIPLLVLSAGTSLMNLLFAVPRAGESNTVFSWGLITITDYSQTRALSIFMRSAALTTLSALSAAATNPFAVVRALMQNAALSPRWGFSLYAALALLPALKDDLDCMKHARRIRLAGKRVSVIDRLSLPVFLLAGAVRRAERIALSMTVRELESAGPRTFLVASPWRAVDTLFIFLSFLLGAVCCAFSFSAGVFRFNLG